MRGHGHRPPGQAARPEGTGGRRFRSTLWRVLVVQVAALALLWLLQAAYHR
ncbi:MAG: hypothetical protein J4F34_07970 [Gemmatimonadetes bacterium]|nr:hypothetical protein [Gemmatimonadota bacterium]